MLGKETRIQDSSLCAEQTAGHVTDRPNCGVPSFLRLWLQFLFSNARWSDWPATATELAGGAVVPGPTLKFAISLALAEQLFGPGRACAEPSFSYSRPLPAPLCLLCTGSR